MGRCFYQDIAPAIRTRSVTDNNDFILEVDKRLKQLLDSGVELQAGAMLDTYNQAVHSDTSCAIRTNINTANHHFVVEEPFNTAEGWMQNIAEPQIGGGISRTVKTDDSLATLVMKEIKIIKEGNYHSSGHNASSIVNTEGLAPTVMENHGTVTAIKEEILIASMRGRNPDNPSERGKSNGNYKQRLGINKNGTTNTITSMQKDNYVIEQVTDTTICLNSKVDGKQPSLEHRIYDSSGNSTAITTVFLPSVTEPQVEQIGNIYPDTDDFKNRTSGRVYSADGLSPTLRTVTGGHNEPKIADSPLKVPQATARGYAECEVGGVFDGSYPNSTTRRGRVQEGGKISPTLTAEGEALNRYEGSYRIRKLTPRECFRLMDVSEEDIDKIQASGVSNSQQYKLAGNSIVVSCLFHIFRTLFIEKQNPDLQMTIFDIL
jgi:DNA (cytosine-5)-methyltransferase 1